MKSAFTSILLRIDTICQRRSDRDDGASLVEYALLVALIAAVCIVAVTFFGDETSATFDSVGKSVQSAN